MAQTAPHFSKSRYSCEEDDGKVELTVLVPESMGSTQHLLVRTKDGSGATGATAGEHYGECRAALAVGPGGSAVVKVPVFQREEFEPLMEFYAEIINTDTGAVVGHCKISITDAESIFAVIAARVLSSRLYLVWTFGFTFITVFMPQIQALNMSKSSDDSMQAVYTASVVYLILDLIANGITKRQQYFLTANMWMDVTSVLGTLMLCDWFFVPVTGGSHTGTGLWSIVVYRAIWGHVMRVMKMGVLFLHVVDFVVEVAPRFAKTGPKKKLHHHHHDDKDGPKDVEAPKPKKNAVAPAPKEVKPKGPPVVASKAPKGMSRLLQSLTGKVVVICSCMVVAALSNYASSALITVDGEVKGMLSLMNNYAYHKADPTDPNLASSFYSLAWVIAWPADEPMGKLDSQLLTEHIVPEGTEIIYMKLDSDVQNPYVDDINDGKVGGKLASLRDPLEMQFVGFNVNSNNDLVDCKAKYSEAMESFGDCENVVVYDRTARMKALARSNLYLLASMFCIMCGGSLVLVFDLTAQMLLPILRISAVVKTVKAAARGFSSSLAEDVDKRALAGADDPEDKNAKPPPPLSTLTVIEALESKFELVVAAPLKATALACLDIERTFGFPLSKESKAIMAVVEMLETRFPTLRTIASTVDDGTLTRSKSANAISMLKPTMPPQMKNTKIYKAVVERLERPELQAAVIVLKNGTALVSTMVKQVVENVEKAAGMTGDEVSARQLNETLLMAARPAVKTAIEALDGTPANPALDKYTLWQLRWALEGAIKRKLRAVFKAMGIELGPEALKGNPRQWISAAEAAAAKSAIQKLKEAGALPKSFPSDFKTMEELKRALESYVTNAVKAEVEKASNVTIPQKLNSLAELRAATAEALRERSLVANLLMAVNEARDAGEKFLTNSKVINAMNKMVETKQEQLSKSGIDISAAVGPLRSVLKAAVADPEEVVRDPEGTMESLRLALRESADALQKMDVECPATLSPEAKKALHELTLVCGKLATAAETKMGSPQELIQMVYALKLSELPQIPLAVKDRLSKLQLPEPMGSMVGASDQKLGNLLSTLRKLFEGDFIAAMKQSLKQKTASGGTMLQDKDIVQLRGHVKAAAKNIESLLKRLVAQLKETMIAAAMPIVQKITEKYPPEKLKSIAKDAANMLQPEQVMAAGKALLARLPEEKARAIAAAALSRVQPAAEVVMEKAMSKMPKEKLLELVSQVVQKVDKDGKLTGAILSATPEGAKAAALATAEQRAAAVVESLKKCETVGQVQERAMAMVEHLKGSPDKMRDALLVAMKSAAEQRVKTEELLGEAQAKVLEKLAKHMPQEKLEAAVAKAMAAMPTDKAKEAMQRLIAELDDRMPGKFKENFAAAFEKAQLSKEQMAALSERLVRAAPEYAAQLRAAAESDDAKERAAKLVAAIKGMTPEKAKACMAVAAAEAFGGAKGKAEAAAAMLKGVDWESMARSMKDQVQSAALYAKDHWREAAESAMKAATDLDALKEMFSALVERLSSGALQQVLGKVQGKAASLSKQLSLGSGPVTPSSAKAAVAMELPNEPVAAPAGASQEAAALEEENQDLELVASELEQVEAEAAVAEAAVAEAAVDEEVAAPGGEAASPAEEGGAPAAE